MRDAEKLSWVGVLDRLLEKDFSQEDLDRLTVSARHIDTWWREWHQQFPCPPEQELTFSLILGR